MKLSEAAKILKGKLLGKDANFESVSTDTRRIQPGELFIALKVPNFDGHHFITAAEQQHAVAALVSQTMNCQIPTIQVTDTLKALGQLGAYRRQQVAIPVIGLTGSCGKTTTKTMIASILQHCGPTLATEGTLNNDIGVPLTLMRLTAQHHYAVIEMGANHAGEIRYVAQLAQPTVALITNAAPAHLEGFGDMAGVARAKGEIYQELSPDGIAILNADDHYADYWKTLIGTRSILQFGLSPRADITAKDIALNAEGKASFRLITPTGEAIIQLPTLGRHNVMNALAATAAVAAIRIPLSAIKAGLEATPSVGKRLVERQSQSGAHLIDDTYNANPLSFQAALEILAQRSGERILVLGDMGELGQWAESYHRQLGEEARRLGIERLYTFGKFSQFTAEAFGPNATHFSNQIELTKALQATLNNQMTVLIKGSRSMHMERIVEALVAPTQ